MRAEWFGWGWKEVAQLEGVMVEGGPMMESARRGEEVRESAVTRGEAR